MSRVMIQPVIMSGGAGTRLWPASRKANPKQFRQLTGEITLFEQTVRRLQGETDALSFASPAVVGAAAQADTMEAQLGAVGAGKATLILEPVARNTAPCAAVAALFGAQSGAETLVLLAPADHQITDVAAFHAALTSGAQAALAGRIVTFGAAPTCPETGYGYIRRGAALSRAHIVDSFVEKPDLETAKRYLAEGGYDWNAGIFLFRADVMLAEMAAHCPEVLAAAEKAFTNGARHGDRLTLDAAALTPCPTVPVDIAVMEKTSRAAVVPVDMGWSDVGSWSAVWELSEKDDRGIAAPETAVIHDSDDCLVLSEGPTVALLGVQDLIVVSTGDAVLVARRGRAQDVKAIVDALKARGLEHLL